MRVLILSITAGEGHNSTAEAIRQSFERHGDEAEVFDAFRYVSKTLYEVIKKGYLLVTKDFKTLFAKSYAMAENGKITSGTSIYRIANLQLTKKLGKYIKSYAPDAIIYTHSFLGVVTDLLKTKGGINVPMIGVVTDFTVHPLWEEARSSDKIVVASDLMKPQLYRKGFTDERIAPIGIPVREQFSHKIDKNEARRKLGIPDIHTVLLMGGSMGYGNIAGVVEELNALDGEFQIISVCGNNAEAKAAIDELHAQKNVLNFGFTKEIDLLMDASDIIITKPGGLTSSEALAKELPIIICNPIPGHEQRNSMFLVNSGAAMITDLHTHVEDVLYQLLNNPSRAETMKNASRNIGKPNSAEDLHALTAALVRQYAEHTEI